MAARWVGEAYVGRINHTWYTLDVSSDLESEREAEEDMVNHAHAILRDRGESDDIAFVGLYHIRAWDGDEEPVA